MQKYLIFAILALFLCSIKTQAQDVQPEQQALVQKVDSLEMELAYLNLNYDLEKLNSGIEKLADQVSLKSVSLQVDIFHHLCNTRMMDVSQKWYESSLLKKQSYVDLSKVIRQLYKVTIRKYKFSQEKLDCLKSAYELTDLAFNALDNALNLHKVVLNFYKDSL